MYSKKGYAWRLGEILIQQGWISWEQLEEALAHQKNPEGMMGKVLIKKGFLSKEKGTALFLGEILIRNGWIQWDQLSEALDLQQANNRILGEILMERGYLTKRNLYEALAIQNKIPFINLKEIRVPNEVIHMFPKSLVHEFKFLPLMKRDGILLIAVGEPREVKAETAVRELVKDHEVRCGLALPEDLDEAIKYYYGSETSRSN